MEDVDESDVIMQGDGDDGNDSNSIPTTMGVRASCMEFGNRTRLASHCRDRNENYASNDSISVAGNIGSFFIPLPISAPRQDTKSVRLTDQGQQQQMNTENSDCDDDISTLTEYSMEENDDDNLSQTTANTTWTCVTEGTGSTNAAAPTSARRKNFGSSETRKLVRRRASANKRTRVQQSRETGNPVLFRDNKKKGDSDQLKRRRKT